MNREKRKPRKAARNCSQEDKKKTAHRTKYFHSYENQRSRLFKDRAGSAPFVIPLIPKRWKLPVCSYLQTFKQHRNSLVKSHDAGRYCQ